VSNRDGEEKGHYTKTDLIEHTSNPRVPFAKARDFVLWIWHWCHFSLLYYVVGISLYRGVEKI
jgi:hypothetical protein